MIVYGTCKVTFSSIGKVVVLHKVGGVRVLVLKTLYPITFNGQIKS